MSTLNEVNKVFKSSLKTGSYKQGIERIEKLLEEKKIENEKIFYKLGFLYDHLALKKKGGKKKELENKAMNLYKKALDINKNYYNALWGIGRIYWHRDSKKALSYAKTTYKKHKKETDSEDFAQNVGLVYESLGDYKKAEIWLKKPLKKTNEPGMFSNLINFYRKTNQLEKAKKYASKTKELFDKKDKFYKEGLVGKMIKETIENADKPIKKSS